MLLQRLTCFAVDYRYANWVSVSSLPQNTPTVSETSNEQHGDTLDSYNHADNLSNEAFIINQRFSQQILKQGEGKIEDTVSKEKYDPNLSLTLKK